MAAPRLIRGAPEALPEGFVELLSKINATRQNPSPKKLANNLAALLLTIAAQQR